MVDGSRELMIKKSKMSLQQVIVLTPGIVVAKINTG